MPRHGASLLKGIAGIEEHSQHFARHPIANEENLTSLDGSLARPKHLLAQSLAVLAILRYTSLRAEKASPNLAQDSPQYFPLGGTAVAQKFVSVPRGVVTALITTLVLLNLAWAAPKEVSLYNFKGGSNDGSAPVGGVVADQAGNLYGTTGTGGSYTDCSPFGQTCGVVFELTPSGGSWKETVLYTFTGGLDGGEPLAGLVIDSQGNLYGTTAIGGSFGMGTVFMMSFVSGSWTESVLYSFQGGSDGAYPQSAVTLHNGSIYGTTYAGGGNYCLGAPSGCGTIFQLQHGNNGWTENVLYRFTNGADGAFPYANLILDPAGNLYGATTQGGYLLNNCAPYGCGNVFQFKHDPSGWTLNTLYAFTYNTDGAEPIGGLFASNNTLYGTASGGGAAYSGTVFQLAYAKGAWTFTLLYTFHGPDGQAPEGALVGKGKYLFGTTHSGGTGSGCFFGSPCGTVFMLNQTTSGWKETVLHSFTNNGTDGVYPDDGLTLIKSALYGTTTAGGPADQGTVFAITQ